MSEFNNILKNGELSIKDHKQLIHLLNGLIIENKKIFERLPYSVQQQLGFDIYRMKSFKFEQVDDIFAKTLFSIMYNIIYNIIVILIARAWS